VVFIALGLVALYQAGNGQRRDSQSSGEVLVEVDRDSPFFQGTYSHSRRSYRLDCGADRSGCSWTDFPAGSAVFIPFILFIKLWLGIFCAS